VRLGTVAAVAAGALFVFALASIPVYAKAPPLTGTGTINFYPATSSTCGNPTAFTPTGSDGNIGFAGNLGTQSNVPTPSNGGYLCVELILNGQNGGASDTYTVSSPALTAVKASGNGATVSAGTVTFTTTSTGNADVYMIFLVTNIGTCVTSPVKISPGVGGTVNTNNQVHHVASPGYPNCTPVTSAPEFPLGLLGMFAVAVPALLLMRKRSLRFAR
jgi:hypothetical protein